MPTIRANIVVLDYYETKVVKDGKLFTGGFNVEVVCSAEVARAFKDQYKDSIIDQFPPEELGYTSLDVVVKREKKVTSGALDAIDDYKKELEKEIASTKKKEKKGKDPAADAIFAAEHAQFLRDSGIIAKFTPPPPKKYDPRDVPRPRAVIGPTPYAATFSNEDVQKMRLHNIVEETKSRLTEKLRQLQAARSIVQSGEPYMIHFTISAEDKVALGAVSTLLAFPFMATVSWK